MIAQRPDEQTWRQRILSLDVPPSMLSDAEIAESLNRIRVWMVEDVAEPSMPMVYQGRMAALKYERNERKRRGWDTKLTPPQLTALETKGAVLPFPVAGNRKQKRAKK